MKSISVVAAVIINDKKILCVQRGDSKYSYISRKFEFPGGKVESNETQEQALAREILEELNMEIQVKEKLTTVDHTYPDFRVIMDTYFCETNSDQLQLTEHIDFKWLPVNNLQGLDWAAADVPIVNTLLELHASNSLP